MSTNNARPNVLLIVPIREPLLSEEILLIFIKKSNNKFKRLNINNAIRIIIKSSLYILTLSILFNTDVEKVMPDTKAIITAAKIPKMVT